ncbi:carbohydrate ABC transporter permease [Luteimicrobium subarcticum]|uniref:Carbohydrate ABC transporter membrane protein 2 (CUT1 family) n=1 Tax=Luteimicrobium subarcticum TaxID=620910 RepID=A0A2M8WRL6_9MICO|nr:carbohydrate ABC transporter permease [Luteimicrobium subarcticum]PJI93585.1 carbohydrate ABC transporter membrane protein 2 (CUT1 family) [Luteimicrobium subarcticum]
MSAPTLPSSSQSSQQSAERAAVLDTAGASDVPLTTSDRVRGSFAGAGRAVAPFAGPVAKVLKYLSLVVACLFALTPLVTIFMASFKTDEEYRTSGPLDAPKSWFNFHNFAVAFTQGDMLRGFMNTTIILVVSIVGTVLIGAMTAYAIDRFDFRGKKLVVFAFLLATLVPGVTTQVATFQIVNALGVFNTRMSAILLFMGTDIVSIYIFLQFMRSIPKALDEAAMLDGANRVTIFTRIVFPLLKPAIATVVIIKGIAVYNEFYIPFLYMPSSDLGVISTSLFRFKGPFGAQWEVISAGTILVIIPTLIVFLALQRFIYNGLTSGATK